jgi:uncharacterized protein involved in outer membrane biogenesis
MASPAARRHRGRRSLILLAVVVAVPAAGYGALRYLLRDDVLRPRLIAAVQQATGRTLTLSGPIGLKLSLVPTVTLDGVALSNAPGGSREQMLTARRVEAKLALLPLFSRRLAFEQVTLIEPDLLLETDAGGRGNWRFEPARAAAPVPAPVQAQPAEPATPLALSIAAIGIEGGRVGWRDGRSGKSEALDIRDLALRAEKPEAPIDFEGNLTFRGVALAARGQGGPLPRLLGAQAEPAEWPLRLSLAAPGVQLVLDGGVTHPENVSGWQASFNATADRADRLAPFLKNLSLPPLTGLDIHAELSDAGGADIGGGRMVSVANLRVHTAGGDLSTMAPGLRLGTATLNVPGPGQPSTATMALMLNGIPWQADAALPGLETLLATAPWPVTLDLHGEGTTVHAAATLSGPRRDQVAGTLSVQSADTLPLLRSFALPAGRLHDLRLETQFARGDTGGSISGLRLQSDGLTLEGDATLSREAGRRMLTAHLNAPRLDLDALGKVTPLPPVGPPVAATPVPVTPPVPAAPTPAPPPAGAEPRRVIPDLPLPVALLNGMDADLHLNVGDLTADGILYRDQRATLVLAGGKLAMDPVSLGVPGGRVSLALAVDASVNPPHFNLTARHEGSGIDLRPLLQTYRLPAQSSGQLEVETALTGQGDGLREVVGSLGGQFGLAMANGQIDNALLDRFAGDLRKLLLPNAPTEGSTPLRCLALRLVLRDGVARPEAMLLESGLANVAGSGEINLRDERLNLRLLPQVRIAGVGISAPVRVTGSFARPGYRLDQGGAAQAAASIMAELAARQKESTVSALGELAEALAGRPAGSLPDCAQQLAVARGGRAGPVPPAESRPAEGRRVNPADLLRGLLGR